ncbi:MAG: DUF4623 domain-containing protein, partial [Verrucomicrobia bacterium]|nr:DUF4623 domain-containing protein [Verrucomicrobiota bacterium]
MRTRRAMNCRQDEVNVTTMRCPTAVASPWTVCFRVFAGYRKWHGALALLTGLGALLLGSPHAQAQGLQKLWEIPADGSRDYVNGFPSERGLVFNPTTGHLLLSSRALGPTVAVLASTNGAELGFLDVTGVSGGSVAIGPLGAGEDGRLYGANISGSDILAPSLRVYRWNNETSAPVVLFSGNPVAGLNARWGDSLAVRGAGTNTQLLVGGGGSSVLLLRYANGAQTSLLAQRIEWPQAGAGSFSQGIAFGIGNQLLA